MSIEQELIDIYYNNVNNGKFLTEIRISCSKYSKLLKELDTKVQHVNRNDGFRCVIINTMYGPLKIIAEISYKKMIFTEEVEKILNEK